MICSVPFLEIYSSKDHYIFISINILMVFWENCFYVGDNLSYWICLIVWKKLVGMNIIHFFYKKIKVGRILLKSGRSSDRIYTYNQNAETRDQERECVYVEYKLCRQVCKRGIDL